VQRVTHRGGNAGPLPVDLPAAIASIEGTARWYGTGLADHALTLARANASVEKISERVEGARQSGVMSAFNIEFARRRREAMKRGARFPSYGGALLKLRRALGENAAAMHTGAVPADIMSRVFGVSD
jgi:hypothetical protein